MDFNSTYGIISIPNYEKPDLIAECLKSYGEWGYIEALIASTLVTEGDSIWDIGAHLGTFSLGLSMKSQVRHILAVDANPEVINDLESNLTNNLNSKFTKLLSGVSSQAGHGIVIIPDNSNHGAARFELTSSNKKEKSDYIPSVTLKALRSLYGNYDFLKLDIEGMEVDALQGDADYISNYKPVIWAECNENKQSLVLLEYLTKLGYSPLYVAFPVIRSEKYKNKPQIIFPMAYEAALVCATPDRLRKFTTTEISDPCIVRKLSNNNDLRRALWDTPRWARQEWVDLSKAELVARIGHLERGDLFESFPEQVHQNSNTTNSSKECNFGITNNRPSTATVQIFWLPLKYDCTEFSESYSNSATVELDGEMRKLSFNLPADQGPLRVRIDPLDRLGIVTIKEIKVLNPQDDVLWYLDRNSDTLHDVSGIVSFPNRDEYVFICVSADPQFEIPIRSTIFTCATDTVKLTIEIKLEELEHGLQRLTKPSTPKAGSHNPTFLNQRLASLANLITKSLKNRDDAIAKQHKNLIEMRGELLKAEGQLELLKDLISGAPKEDWL